MAANMLDYPVNLMEDDMNVLRLWISYFLSYWPSVPGFGRIETADCIFVQSFGRNTYNDAELGRVLYKLRTQANLNDLETMVLLKQQGFDPGASNLALGRKAMKLCARLGAPIITQWEVAFAIFSLDPSWFMRHQENIDCIWPPTEGYFATAHVKMASKLKMLVRGRKHPLELAHPAMVTRAVPIIWSIGISPIVEKIDSGKENELWVWDKKSVQPWTRDWDSWKHREFVGRLAHVAAHLLAAVGLLEFVRSKASAAKREMIPGDWIAMLPPKATM